MTAQEISDSQPILATFAVSPRVILPFGPRQARETRNASRHEKTRKYNIVRSYATSVKAYFFFVCFRVSPEGPIR